MNKLFSLSTTNLYNPYTKKIINDIINIIKPTFPKRYVNKPQINNIVIEFNTQYINCNSAYNIENFLIINPYINNKPVYAIAKIKINATKSLSIFNFDK